jgi:hypothetical protein
VRAERVAVEVRQEAETADHALAKIEVEQQRVTADIAALESRIQVAEVTEPVAASEPATPERERARQEATRTVALQARLTCAAAALLARSATISPEAAADLGEAQQQLAAFASLAAQAAAAPIDGAMRVRARCLAALTAVRRALPAPAATTGEAADALLEALSEAGHGAPRRDERGVVLTLRGLFVGDALSAAGKKTLAEIASVAQRFARFPVMVLVHHEVEPAERDRTRSEARGAAVVAALEQVLGPGAIGAAHQLGAAEPLVDPRSSYRQRNERVEIVLVAPTTM